MPYIGAIASIVGTGIKLATSASGPSYPSPPKIKGINIPSTTGLMEANESKRMAASINAWRQRFPLLYQGGKYEIGDLTRNQQGYLSDTTNQSLSNAGLAPIAGQGKNQYQTAVNLGLSPITLAQRTSQAVTRQIAMNPEWTSKISGGTLATMIANNAKNQNAFTQFLGAQNTANFVNQQTQNAYNTQALTSGLLGTAGIAANYSLANRMYSPLSTYGQGAYTSQPSVSSPAYSPQTGGYYPNYGNQIWNAPATGGMYSNTWSGGFGAQSLPPSPNFSQTPDYSGTDLWNSYQPTADQGLNFNIYGG